MLDLVVVLMQQGLQAIQSQKQIIMQKQLYTKHSQIRQENSVHSLLELYTMK